MTRLQARREVTADDPGLTNFTKLKRGFPKLGVPSILRSNWGGVLRIFVVASSSDRT